MQRRKRLKPFVCVKLLRKEYGITIDIYVTLLAGAPVPAGQSTEHVSPATGLRVLAVH